MKVIVKQRNGRTMTELELSNEATTRDLSLALSKQFPKFTPERQSFSVEKQKLQTQDRLSTYSPKSSKEALEITFKDLGMQISWKTVFLIEYFGPMFIHPLLYLLSPVGVKSDVQAVILAMMVVHFGKRELETLFVHRFSHATMPVMNVFKNSFHYWVLSGLWIAYDVYSPTFQHAKMDTFKWALVGVWAWAELSNLHTHITLKNLRPPGTTVRKIPKGYGFSQVFKLSCPNYFFETIGWLAVCGICPQSIGAWVFFVVATAQMYAWAVKKHKNYRKEFPQYPKNRHAMFPLI